jgi:cysteine-rich repeat protein
VVSVCGNHRVEAGEACDDGDTSGGDGCDGSCQVQTGWICFGDPSFCVPSSGVVRVPGDATSISEALGVVEDGGTVVVEGPRYDECLSFVDGRAIALVSEELTRIDCGGSGDAIMLRNGSSLTLVGLQVSSSADSDDAIRVEHVGSTLRIHRCVLGPSVSQAVDALAGSDVWITESIISGARAGALRIWTDAFRIENNLIFGNTGDASAAAAVHFRGTGLESSAFRFNTVVDNIADPGNGAVWCDGVSMTHHGNIVAHTSGGADSVGCDHAHSLIGDTELGGSNISGDPMLDGDYHLLAGSRCIDAGGPASPTTDVDYDRRSMGAGPDIGADERE